MNIDFYLKRLLLVFLLLSSVSQTARPLSATDLKGKTPSQLSLMRNEIYARHGYIFHRTNLETYFLHQRWYHPVTNDANQVLAKMTLVERKNIAILDKTRQMLMSEAHPKDTVKSKPVSPVSTASTAPYVDPLEVTYTVDGTADSASVTYSISGGGTQQESNVSLPWTKTFEGEKGDFLYVSAQNDGDSGDVSVEIDVGGDMKKYSTSTGAYVIADTQYNL